MAKTLFFLAMCAAVLVYLAARLRRPPSTRRRCVDAIVPAYNEAPCLGETLRSLYANPYIARIICVNDGSTDDTGPKLDAWARVNPRLIAVHQANSGKGGAIMRGLAEVTADYVFLTDSDTRVPADEGLGYLLAEFEAGADAVGGIPSSDLRNGGALAFVRATVKLPMIILKRTFQQMLGGAPFIISGACGMFRTAVLRQVGLSDRTNVEDLDLTWELVTRGYRLRQSPRCIVYPQECRTLREEWRRWRRWIMGYAVCMRLHRGLLATRFGLFSILPMFATVVIGIALYASAWGQAALAGKAAAIPLMLVPLLWVAAVATLGAISAIHHRRPALVLAAPAAVIYVLLAYAVWLIHGARALISGRELGRDKPTRYSNVVA